MLEPFGDHLGSESLSGKGSQNELDFLKEFSSIDPIHTTSIRKEFSSIDRRSTTPTYLYRSRSKELALYAKLTCTLYVTV